MFYRHMILGKAFLFATKYRNSDKVNHIQLKFKITVTISETKNGYRLQIGCSLQKLENKTFV